MKFSYFHSVNSFNFYILNQFKLLLIPNIQNFLYTILLLCNLSEFKQTDEAILTSTGCYF